jgi:hypothetical protein
MGYGWMGGCEKKRKEERERGKGKREGEKRKGKRRRASIMKVGLFLFKRNNCARKEVARKEGKEEEGQRRKDGGATRNKSKCTHAHTHKTKNEKRTNKERMVVLCFFVETI